MSKSHKKPEDSFQNLNEQVKRLRFHPYYYMGRKGIFYDKKGKRFQIKIVKLYKDISNLEIYFQERKRLGQKFKVSIKWENVDFDYYTIKTINEGLFKFSQKK